MTTTSLYNVVQQIVEYEHMGTLCSDAQIDVTVKSNSLTINWDAVFEGKVVRQAAYFKFTGIYLGKEEV